MAIPRKYQRKDDKWWFMQKVVATASIQAATFNRNNTDEQYGICGVTAGCQGLVYEKTKGGLIVQFESERHRLWAHIKARYADLDLVEGE